MLVELKAGMTDVADLIKIRNQTIPALRELLFRRSTVWKLPTAFFSFTLFSSSIVGKVPWEVGFTISIFFLSLILYTISDM